MECVISTHFVIQCDKRWNLSRWNSKVLSFRIARLKTRTTLRTIPNENKEDKRCLLHRKIRKRKNKKDIGNRTYRDWRWNDLISIPAGFPRSMSVITQSVITRVITGYLLHFHPLSWNYIRKHKRRNYHDDNNRVPSKPMRLQGHRDFYADNKFDMEKESPAP